MVWFRPDDDDLWNETLDTLCGDAGGHIAVLRAYLDASHRKDSGLFSIAGYLMESGRVRRFRQEWREAFGQETFSWADLIASQKPFKYLRDNTSERDRLIAAGVSLIREYVIAGSVVSCWAQDVENFGPTWIKGYGHVYSIAGHMAMAGMGTWAKANNYRGGISYVIEAGDDGYDQLAHLLSYAPKSKEVVEMYQWRGHATIPKEPYSPFHAPDMLAWEWGKYITETRLERKRPMRLSLVNLLHGRLDKYAVMHLYGEPLMRFFKGVHDVGVEQLQEDAAALASVQPIDLSGDVQASEQITRDGDPE